jgi:hypothetical protein
MGSLRTVSVTAIRVTRERLALSRTLDLGDVPLLTGPIPGNGEAPAPGGGTRGPEGISTGADRGCVSTPIVARSRVLGEWLDHKKSKGSVHLVNA